VSGRTKHRYISVYLGMRDRLVDSANDTAAMRLLATSRASSFLYRMNVYNRRSISRLFVALFVDGNVTISFRLRIGYVSRRCNRRVARVGFRFASLVLFLR